MLPPIFAHAVLFALPFFTLFGCDSGATDPPSTAAVPKLWCNGQLVNPDLIARLTAEELADYAAQPGCSWGEPPPVEPIDPIEPKPQLQPDTAARVELPNGNLKRRVMLDVWGLSVPVEYTLERASREDQQFQELGARQGEAGSLVRSLPQEESPELRQALTDSLDATKAARQRLRKLGDSDSATALAVMSLSLISQYPWLGATPEATGLVAVFDDSFCNGKAELYRDGSAVGGVDPAVIQAYFKCQAQEIEFFIIIEAIADSGDPALLGPANACLSAAAGSYELFTRCIRGTNSGG